MEKPTEQEVIPIYFAGSQKKLLAYELERSISNTPMFTRVNVSQFRFLESVLKKLKNKVQADMLFSARECATLSGWMLAHAYLRKDKHFITMRNVIENGLTEWEKTQTIH